MEKPPKGSFGVSWWPRAESARTEDGWSYLFINYPNESIC